MIRVVSTFCVGLMGFSILSLYHVSEQTRVARQELAGTEKSISAERDEISVLEAQWQKVAGPDTIQRLAQSSLGMNDTTTVQLSSLTLLPRRGDEPLNNEPVRAASAQVPAAPAPVVRAAVRSGM
ncbi:MAG TPA: hypothetical protein VMU01_09140 [Rhizomicrobium sp.]|nr:hypothetical protein [Rhizomicrobium sp.]